MYFQLQIV